MGTSDRKRCPYQAAQRDCLEAVRQGLVPLKNEMGPSREHNAYSLAFNQLHGQTKACWEITVNSATRNFLDGLRLRAPVSAMSYAADTPAAFGCRRFG
ncbi:hypothetical protein HPP92_028868 [Vanilla planifolia]|uniref:Uncharacterized protein n=1 Tax=Vanilla planifolia TaxID=51239 RepID=A0A835P5T2_VANPL|nr:hypothetical protein HPP92_028868 [Vanilla planifolia]KAG0446385.1 hypothetical protein HPP92_028857 [Vanilla planifolia]